MVDEQLFLCEINTIPWQQPEGNSAYRSALLVFADWLEEQGDSRGELIRLREGLLQHPPKKQRVTWEPRLQELLNIGTSAVVAFWQNSIGMKFCWCPPGKFSMGSSPTEKEHNWEREVDVTLTQGFWLGTFLVTQGEYEKVMGKNPSNFFANGDGQLKVVGQDTSRFPVENVSWLDAIEYCQKLTEQERAANRLIVGWEYSLPTEAEWEYACRAGTMSATAFGTSLSSSQANFNGDSPYNDAERGPRLKRPASVGTYASNAWGLYDMHGNVWEWCWDAFEDTLPGGTDPIAVYGAPSESYRINRGGGWLSDGVDCRSATRGLNSRRSSFNSLGFRVSLILRADNDAWFFRTTSLTT